MVARSALEHSPFSAFIPSNFTGNSRWIREQLFRQGSAARADTVCTTLEQHKSIFSYFPSPVERETERERDQRVTSLWAGGEVKKAQKKRI